MYKAVNACTDSIKIEDITVGGTAVSQSYKPKFQGMAEVSLFVKPVGCVGVPTTDAQLRVAIVNVLNFLVQFHQFSFCHRDLRWDNIICYNNAYYLIDFELADYSGQNVEFNQTNLPVDVQSKVQSLVCSAVHGVYIDVKYYCYCLSL